MAVFNEKLHVDLLSSDDIIALQIMDVFSTYFLLMPVRPENPRGVWDAFCC